MTLTDSDEIVITLDDSEIMAKVTDLELLVEDISPDLLKAQSPLWAARLLDLHRTRAFKEFSTIAEQFPDDVEIKHRCSVLYDMAHSPMDVSAVVENQMRTLAWVAIDLPHPRRGSSVRQWLIDFATLVNSVYYGCIESSEVTSTLELLGAAQNLLQHPAWQRQD